MHMCGCALVREGVSVCLCACTFACACACVLACVRACVRACARSCASVHASGRAEKPVRNHTCIRLLEPERAGDECYPIDEITCVCAREFVRVCARAHPGLDVHSRF